MGYLYERLLEELGPRKVTQAEKRSPGYRGIDFLHTTPSELRVINLKAGLSTSNGDITDSTIRNLVGAKEHWGTLTGADDNPLAQRERNVVMVRAVARGKRKQTITGKGILWLVGESMWEYFGAGSGVSQEAQRGTWPQPLGLPALRVRERTGSRARHRISPPRQTRRHRRTDRLGFACCEVPLVGSRLSFHSLRPSLNEVVLERLFQVRRATAHLVELPDGSAYGMGEAYGNRVADLGVPGRCRPSECIVVRELLDPGVLPDGQWPGLGRVAEARSLLNRASDQCGTRFGEAKPAPENQLALQWTNRPRP